MSPSKKWSKKLSPTAEVDQLEAEHLAAYQELMEIDQRRVEVLARYHKTFTRLVEARIELHKTRMERHGGASEG